MLKWALWLGWSNRLENEALGVFSHAIFETLCYLLHKKWQNSNMDTIKGNAFILFETCSKSQKKNLEQNSSS